ncbi:hypothetical protein AMAG_11848 [Allomyces macrogynus ATCC 38327]|uniref:Aminotransferase class I/classII large domain-containing protein n=1 Tax=Allomyces macrogynus (strain ATCC 38327) TaxID=578462 RepID=A0A0L0SY06_ALLM3|nr:hypothetical protein AMAG_11848 [Allomyces macrogynus ATCC 38327]|eukprot:KNE67381.1 hypothetical protein AMAG_11848 [Allomyces macrogynus ATCC 38327]
MDPTATAGPVAALSAPSFFAHVDHALASRRARSLARTLTDPTYTTDRDFASNDYLGLAHSPALASAIHAATVAASNPDGTTPQPHGATGSRLLSGHTPRASALEARLARLHGSEAGLLFNSGYAANLAVLATLPQPGDLIVLDEFVHASVWDGVRLGVGRKPTRAPRHITVPHADVGAVRTVIVAERERETVDAVARPCSIFIAVEAVYSMDGTVAPLRELVDMIEELGDVNVHLIVDEAHSSGAMGLNGTGLVCALGLEDKIPFRLHTFGKGIGCHGAVFLCSAAVRDSLINYARPLVYSTMMPTSALIAIECAYTFLEGHAEQLQRDLQVRIATFRSACSRYPSLDLVPSTTHIQGIRVAGGNAAVVRIARDLREQGWYTLPIRAPTVPKGAERIRLCLHTFNSNTAILALVDAMARAVGADQIAAGDSFEMAAKL